MYRVAATDLTCTLADLKIRTLELVHPTPALTSTVRCRKPVPK